MKLNLRLVALSAILVSAASGGAFLSACGGGGGTSDGGADAAKEGGGKEAGVKDTGGNDTGDDSGNPVLDPQCTVPAVGNGACSPALDDAGIECNAITNAGCDASAGEACDFNQNGGLSCFPAPNVQDVCATCDNGNGPFCKASEHCVPTTTGSSCARICCTDNDCTPGHCDTQTLGSAPLGFCVK